MPGRHGDGEGYLSRYAQGEGKSGFLYFAFSELDHQATHLQALAIL